MRKFIFKDTETGAELILPVTPSGYGIEHGRKVNNLDMYSVGQINLPGEKILLDETLECLLPAREYPFMVPGAGTDPWVYVEQLEKWSDAGTVLRFIVSGTPVNTAVILDPISYREQDGTHDVYCKIPLRGYRELSAASTSTSTGNAERTVETEPETQSSYVVQSGDTLSGICRRFYGDSTLAARLAAANGVKNVNLIRVGQVLEIPEKSLLPAAAAQPASVKAAAATYVAYDSGISRWLVTLDSGAVSDG